MDREGRYSGGKGWSAMPRAATGYSAFLAPGVAQNHIQIERAQNKSKLGGRTQQLVARK